MREEEQAQVTQVGPGARAGVSGKGGTRAWGAGAAQDEETSENFAKHVNHFLSANWWPPCFHGVDLSFRHIRRVGATSPNCHRCRASLERLSRSASSRRLCICNVCCLSSPQPKVPNLFLLAESCKFRQHRVRIFCRFMSKLHQGRVVLRGDLGFHSNLYRTRTAKHEMQFLPAFKNVWTDAPQPFFKLLEAECQQVWTSSLRDRRPADWDDIDVPVVPLGSNLFCDPLAGFLWECKLEKILWKNVKQPKVGNA